MDDIFYEQVEKFSKYMFNLSHEIEIKDKDLKNNLDIFKENIYHLHGALHTIKISANYNNSSDVSEDDSEDVLYLDIRTSDIPTLNVDSEDDSNFQTFMETGNNFNKHRVNRINHLLDDTEDEKKLEAKLDKTLPLTSTDPSPQLKYIENLKNMSMKKKVKVVEQNLHPQNIKVIPNFTLNAIIYPKINHGVQFYYTTAKHSAHLKSIPCMHNNMFVGINGFLYNKEYEPTVKTFVPAIEKNRFLMWR
jgi:hypothetical protein